MVNLDETREHAVLFENSFKTSTKHKWNILKSYLSMIARRHPLRYIGQALTQKI